MSNAPAIAPSTQLKIMRELLGMDRVEISIALGGAAHEDIRNLERTNTFFGYTVHESLLMGMWEKVEAHIDETLAAGPRPYLVTFTKDEDFKQFEPELQSWMLFASVHRMFTGRVWAEWIADGVQAYIVGMRVPDYLEFLQTRSASDTPENRVEWAAGYAQNYIARDRVPDVTRNAEDELAARTERRRPSR